jgi:hypothetical protein
LTHRLGKGARDLALRWCVTRSGERVTEWLLSHAGDGGNLSLVK